MVEHLKTLLTDQLALMRAAVQVLDESRSCVFTFADRLDSELTISERESCEALTSRFARRNDFLLQRVFRTLDQIELADEAVLDRLQRAETRGLISAAERWRELRLLWNAIAHDYLIESADRVNSRIADRSPRTDRDRRMCRPLCPCKGLQRREFL
ncbi:MAG: hypothetical protein CK530_01920 [Planctomycetaceae bacterium]|nr:MAG: hypothetical protein CK530_01920 [Planctomycetaceae bacterium]